MLVLVQTSRQVNRSAILDRGVIMAQFYASKLRDDGDINFILKSRKTTPCNPKLLYIAIFR